jgi:hypothetical protein
MAASKPEVNSFFDAQGAWPAALGGAGDQLQRCRERSVEVVERACGATRQRKWWSGQRGATGPRVNYARSPLPAIGSEYQPVVVTRHAVP